MKLSLIASKSDNPYNYFEGLYSKLTLEYSLKLLFLLIKILMTSCILLCRFITRKKIEP